MRNQFPRFGWQFLASFSALPQGERAAIEREAVALIDSLLDGLFAAYAGYPPVFRERVRRNLRRLLLRFLADELSELSRLVPAYFELSFGLAAGEGDLASAEPIEIPGTGVRLAGAIDRVELARVGGLLQVMVYDYKSGSVPGTTEILGGIGFQLPLYLMVVEQLLALRGEPFELVVPLGGRYFQVADLSRYGRRGGVYDREGVEAQGLRVRQDAGSLTGDALDGLIDDYRERAVLLARRMQAGDYATGALLPRWMGCDRCGFRAVCRVDHARNACRAARATEERQR